MPAVSHISRLKLSTQDQSQRGKLAPKDRMRARAVEYLQHQRALAEGELSGSPYVTYKTVFRTDAAGERVRIQAPRHIRRGWFEDGKGTVFFSLYYGSKPLPLDKAGNTSIEVGSLGALPGIIDTLGAAINAGELDAQLNGAAQDRRKNFKRRTKQAQG